MDKKTVSIGCITYNHEKYIAQTLDSFLMQKTTFDFEIVVGEDCSTDNTRQILLAYKERHPDKFKLLLNEKNLGMQPNGIQTLKACTGKYIASCEGDDYWTDPLKLQKQVDFLEANPDYAICHHQMRKVYEEGRHGEEFSEPEKDTTTFEDLARRQHIGTLTAVYRNHIIGEFPDWYEGLAFGDYGLFLLLAQHGKIKYFNEPMAVYRIHGQGAASGKNDREKMINWLAILKQTREHFYPRGYHEFTEALADIYPGLCFHLYEEGKCALYRKYFAESLKYARTYSARLVSSLTARYFLSYAPFVNPIYERTKRKLIGKTEVPDTTYNQS